MKPFARSERVGMLIQEILSDILFRNIKDPRLRMVTITGVKLSSDLKSARIYFMAKEGKSRAPSIEKGFKSAMGFIKRRLASELELRYMPHLAFYYDESFDYGDRINAVLKTIATQDDGKNYPPTGTES